VSSRVLRDDLWTSERVNALHDKTFRLYVCLFNAADDYGLVQVGFGDIRRASPLLSWTREDVAKMLGELVDAGLIRPYEFAGKPYAAIERWQPFIRSIRPKYPVPGFGMGHVRTPYGFKDRRTKQAASLILKHLDIEIAPLGDDEGNPGTSLGSIGLRAKGVRELGSKEEKKNTPRRIRATEAFEAFWQAYPHFPHRSSRALSVKRWGSLKLEAIAGQVMVALRACLDVPEWTKDGRRFVSAAEVWLNKQLWQQEEIAAVRQSLIESIARDPRCQ
jgi:hypothetical protein